MTELQKAAIAYADSQRETAQACGWHEEKQDDFIAGAEWQKQQGQKEKVKGNSATAGNWILFEDNKEMPRDVDFLVKLEDGSVYLYSEELPFLIITHWKHLQP